MFSIEARQPPPLNYCSTLSSTQLSNAVHFFSMWIALIEKAIRYVISDIEDLAFLIHSYLSESAGLERAALSDW
jgi:hypothetical protein